MNSRFSWSTDYHHPTDWNQSFAPLSLPDMFAASAARKGDAPMLDFMGRQFGYAEVAGGVARVARGLQLLGEERRTKNEERRTKNEERQKCASHTATRTCRSFRRRLRPHLRTAAGETAKCCGAATRRRAQNRRSAWRTAPA